MMAIVVHTLHVLAATAWVGGYAMFALVVWPTLFARDASPSRATFAALSPRIGVFMAVVGSSTLLLGIIRAAGWSNLRSLRDLVTTPYGITLSVAFVLTVGVMVHGARAGRTLEARLFDGEKVRDGARAELVRSSAISLTCFCAILICMGLMHFGL